MARRKMATEVVRVAEEAHEKEDYQAELEAYRLLVELWPDLPEARTGGNWRDRLQRAERLARYRNEVYGDNPQRVIPQVVIDRPPSAELAPGQVDEDNLPPYEILDQILELYVEQDQSAADICARGFDEGVVRRVLRLVDLNEYKRRQSPVGVRLTQRGFGRDRRYPLTNGWEIGE